MLIHSPFKKRWLETFAQTPARDKSIVARGPTTQFEWSGGAVHLEFNPFGNLCKGFVYPNIKSIADRRKLTLLKALK